MGNGRICAFFGHRTIDRDISGKVEAAIREAITKYGVTTFLCGNKGAFDLLAAGTAHRLKQEFPTIEVLFVRAYFPKTGEQLEEIYDDSIYPDGLETVPRRFAISERNRWMAKHCDCAITYIIHTYGGAYEASRLLDRQKKPCLPVAE